MNTSSRFHYGWIILGMGVLAVFGSLGLTRFGYAMVLPDMKADLGIDNTQAGAIASASLIGYLILSVIGGAMATRYGPRLIITLGLAAAGTGTILTGLSHSVHMAMASQFLAGAGSGAGNIPVVGLVASWVAPRRLGAASGTIVAGSSLGLILVGLVSPPVLSHYAEGWRVCWFIFGGITLLLSIAAYLLLRNHPSEKELRPMGASDGETVQPGKRGILQWGKVYRSRAVWKLGLVYTAFGFSYIIYMTFFRQQLTDEAGYSKDAAGQLYMMLGWVSLFCGLWGLMSDRIGRKRALMMVYGMHAVAFALFGLWATPTGFTLSVVLFGLSAWSVPAIMTATCGEMLGARLAPAALGFLTLFFGTGQVIGPIIGGALADMADSLLPAYCLAAAVALLGVLGASFLKPEPPATAPEPDSFAPR